VTSQEAQHLGRQAKSPAEVVDAVAHIRAAARAATAWAYRSRHDPHFQAQQRQLAEQLHTAADALGRRLAADGGKKSGKNAIGFGAE
jgi:hypothetical protein